MSSAALRIPTPDAALQAHEALRVLSTSKRRTAPTLQVIEDSAQSVSVIIPKDAFDLLLEILGHLATGTAVSIVPIQAELTTQQAAEMLNMPRQNLSRLLDTGDIPCKRIGAHRRVLVKDLLAYRDQSGARCDAALDELTAEAQRLGLGY